MIPEWLRTIPDWLIHVFEIALLVAAAAGLRWLALKWLRPRKARATTNLGGDLVQLSQRIITPILILVVGTISLHFFSLSEDSSSLVIRIFKIGLLAVVLFYAFRGVQLVLNRCFESAGGRESFREPIQFLKRVAFAIFGAMLIMENLGISLTAVWTTLGIGSVAVALAMQDTLSNFFAGVYLRIDNPIRLGDYIKLETGEEGFVVQQG